jgi:hypothetical protein
VLIVEAKRFDFTDKQEPPQLASEWLAGRRAHVDKSLWLLAVGGIPDSRSETVKKTREAVYNVILRVAAGNFATDDLHFAALPWFRLFKVIKGRCERQPGLGPHAQRLIDDIREGMLLHGVSVSQPSWLVDLMGPAWKRDRLSSRGSISAFVRLPSCTWTEFRPVLTPPAIFVRRLRHDLQSP